MNWIPQNLCPLRKSNPQSPEKLHRVTLLNFKIIYEVNVHYHSSAITDNMEKQGKMIFIYADMNFANIVSDWGVKLYFANLFL